MPTEDEKRTEESISVQLEHVCLQYPYKQLEVATKGFNESCRLGEGSAGTVFRAELQDGSYAAVKVIDLSTLGDNLLVAGFEDEIMILSKFRHPNLVVLMGWAKEGTRRFLLYEFLSGGDVSGRLQKSKDGRMPFLWHERLSVARDAATGLAHLHNATPRAFHRDIKSSNILLGASGAKMADFGLSVAAKTRTGSAVDCEFPSGTPGYACPIYMRTGKVTEGSEVHSFGMVLFEVLLNMVPAGMVIGEVKFPIQDAVIPMAPGALERAVANADPTAGWLLPVAREVASLALSCIDPEESNRPCFNDICRRLRHLQEQFPPTSVLAPQLAQVNFTAAGVPPPPGVTGVCGPLPAAFQSPPGPADHALGMVAAAPQGPGPPAPPVPSGPFWMHSGHVGPAMTGPAFLGTLPPGAPPLPPPAVGGSVRLPPPSAVLGPGCQPNPPAMFEMPAPAWPMTTMGPVMAGPALSVIHQPVPVGAPMQLVPPEVALEITYVHLAVLAMMRPEYRMLPLVPSIDPEGRRCARFGRAHQPQWFEAVLLDASHLGCVSREACEFCWGGPDPSQAGLVLRVLGTTVVIVDDDVKARGGTVPLHPGARISLAMQTCPGGELCIIISLALHCATAGVAAPTAAAGNPGQPASVAAHSPPMPAGRSVQVPVEMISVKDKAAAVGPVWAGQQATADMQPQAQEGMWRLECVYAASLAPEAFCALPTTIRHVSFALSRNSPSKLLGRQHQPEMFEALLGRDATLLSRVSRNHFKLEAGEDSVVKVTNMSQNIAVVAQKPLHQGESLEVLDGDTLSFAHTVPTEDASRKGSADSSVSIVPFLTLRLVGPPPAPPTSPFEMLNSLPIVAPLSSEESPPAAWAPLAAQAGTGEAPESGKAVGLPTAPAASCSKRRPPAVREEGHEDSHGEITLVGASTAPVPKLSTSSLLCSADSVHKQGTDCTVM